jgi:two-component system, response regulator
MTREVRHTILLVEDNNDAVELTRRAFDKSGVPNRIVAVSDGQSALDYLFAAADQSGREPTVMPSVVLLDLNLPRIDGLEVLRRLRADPRTKLLPVVILTTSNERQDVIGSYDLGANSYVRKPIDFAQFVEAARQLGLYWLVLNELPPARGFVRVNHARD